MRNQVVHGENVLGAIGGLSGRAEVLVVHPEALPEAKPVAEVVRGHQPVGEHPGALNEAFRYFLIFSTI